MKNENLILNGNEAFALGSVKAGLSTFAGYPITPSTEVFESLEKELPKINKNFIFSESELAAINILMGVGAAGEKALTATSGCAFSLMQESISYMAADFVPCVILNVMREGAGLGDVPPSQGDYNQMTKGGGNGDYHAIVIACSSISDCYNFPRLCFNLAFKYRTPVIATYDAAIAHLKGNVDILNLKYENEDLDKSWCLDGHKKDKRNIIQNIYYHHTDTFDVTLNKKYEMIENNEQRYETFDIEDAKIILVAFSICAMICKEAVKILREKGLKVGLIIPITLYPFPEKAFKNLKNVEKIISVELNIFAQMKKDIEYFTQFKYETLSINKMSTIPNVKDIVDFVEKNYV